MSDTELFTVGRTRSMSVRFAQDTETGRVLGAIKLDLEPRDWDVNDPKAREAAGREALGSDYDWHREHQSAQWWIDTDRNAAALAVYRLREEPVVSA